MAEQRLFTKDFFLIAFARMGSSMVFATFTATIASFAVNTYGVDSSLAGVAVGMFILAALVSRVLAGRYMEVIGRRRLVLVGGIAFLAATLAYLIPMPFWAFVVVRALHGIVFGALSNTLNVISICFVPRERLAEGMGYFSLAATAASAIGPFVGIWAYQTFSYTLLFVLCSCYAAIGLLLSFFMAIKPVELTDEQRAEIMGKFRLRDCFEVTAIPLCLMVTLCDIFYYSVSSFLSLYSIEIGLEEYCSLYFVVYSVTLFVTRPFTGRLMDRRGEDIVMYPCFVFLVIGYILLANCQNLPMLILSSIFLATGRSTIFCTVQTMAVRSVPDHRMGVATGTFFAFADTGAGLGPMIMGSLLPLLGGYANMYTFEAVAAVVLMAYFFVLTRVLGKRP